MIVFKTLTMRNFMSFGNNTTVINFERPGTTLIIGEDLDNTSNGQGGNGVGKTSILNALVYALYDRPISNISKDNLVNNINGKDMNVTITFSNNGNEYLVTRSRKTKAGASGNNVSFFENQEDKTRDLSETNKLIAKAIGLPYELFVRIVVFSANHEPFLDLPTSSTTNSANQTDIIEELFGLTMISEKAALLKKFISDAEASVKIQQTKIEHLVKEHERHATQITNAEKRVEMWVIQNKTTIDNLISKVNKLGNVDIAQQKILQNALKEIDKHLSTELETQRQHERNIKTLVEKYNKGEKDLTHLRDDKCPYCLQHFKGAHDKIDLLEQQTDKIYDQIEIANQQLAKVNDNIKSLTSVHIDTKNRITVSNIEELLAIKNESENITEKIRELENAINPFADPLQELLDTKIEPIDYSEINKLTKDIDHQKFLLKLLTKKDSFIRKALLNKNIPYLNQQLQHYLTTLGLPHVVEFTHQMTAKISQFGKQLDFGNLSNGQRARVNIALSFAFKDVLQRLHTKINICMLDEILDTGLDAVGVQAAARLLKKKAREEGTSMYIISHRDEIDSIFDHKMTVQLSKGFSYIVDSLVTENDKEAA